MIGDLTGQRLDARLKRALLQAIDRHAPRFGTGAPLTKARAGQLNELSQNQFRVAHGSTLDGSALADV